MLNIQRRILRAKRHRRHRTAKTNLNRRKRRKRRNFFQNPSGSWLPWLASVKIRHFQFFFAHFAALQRYLMTSSRPAKAFQERGQPCPRNACIGIETCGQSCPRSFGCSLSRAVSLRWNQFCACPRHPYHPRLKAGHGAINFGLPFSPGRKSSGQAWLQLQTRIILWNRQSNGLRS